MATYPGRLARRVWVPERVEWAHQAWFTEKPEPRLHAHDPGQPRVVSTEQLLASWGESFGGRVRLEAEGAPPEAVARTLRARLDRAGTERDFETLLSFASFYVAELDPSQAGDPFHPVLLDHLLAAAAHFEKSAPLKRLFLLTLLADVFPAAPEGISARAEAQDKVFSLIAGLNPEPMATLAEAEPSGLPGLSVNPIENGTAHHLLLFFEGPERFFVRVPPVRKGVAVFKSGKYAQAALVTADQVVPYRGEHLWTDGRIQSSYSIETRGSGGEVRGAYEHKAKALGDYVLLRAPGATRFEVDPSTAGSSGIDSGRGRKHLPGWGLWRRE